jgi:hypothetical protein
VWLFAQYLSLQNNSIYMIAPHILMLTQLETVSLARPSPLQHVCFVNEMTLCPEDGRSESNRLNTAWYNAARHSYS